jgi:heat-inducible transcriptional repressor
MSHPLNDRERAVLEAVIQTYIETAEPTGSRTIAKRFPLGVSAATIRNTMSDLEDRGYLFHPHTSAGRIPTDRAYRVYVDAIIRDGRVELPDHAALSRELRPDAGVIEGLLQKAAQVLGVLTSELGVAVAPSLDHAVLERLELMPVSAERILMILVLRGGLARTIYVEVSSHLPAEAVLSVARVLNERLAGLTLSAIRTTVRERLRDTSVPSASELLNIFVEEADHLFDVPAGSSSDVLLGSAQPLADQPEFNTSGQVRRLLELTERRDVLRTALQERRAGGLTITIGGENTDPALSAFTIVTASYRHGGLSGVIGVMGPTRMPYEKVIGMVENTSRLVEDLAG